ncbi:MAG: hypothetical protein IPG50_00105 [Myxococcales bacterium]|nr:hypothetical protein [Myxococcales bacterium]
MSTLAEVLAPDERASLSVVQRTATSPWTEDDREYGVDGDVRIPARWGAPSRQETLNEVRTLQQRARTERGVYGNFGVQSMVAYLGARDAVEGSIATEQPLRENLSYAEGGNVLRGANAAGDPYAIVGQDTVELTRAVLARDLGRPVSATEAEEAIAHDLGVAPTLLYPVEQPGDFHLDMAMLPLGGGQIVVNDAREAAALQAHWLREDAGMLHGGYATGLEARIARLKRTANERAIYEDQVADALRAQGFEVHRMAGVFPSTAPGRSLPMNFFNTEAGVGADDQSFLVMMGGDARAQAYVQGRLKEIPSSGIDRVYFLPADVNANLLNEGGLNCRVKAIGEPLSAAEVRARRSRRGRPAVSNLNCPSCFAPLIAAPFCRIAAGSRAGAA